MPSENVLSDEILRDARKKAGETLAHAKREAEALRATAAKEADATVRDALAAATRRAESTAKAVLATVVQEAHRDLLEAREGELGQLFEAARRRLADRRYDYPAVLAGLAAEAVAAVHADRVVLEVAEADRALATEAWMAEVRKRAGRQVDLSLAPQPAAIDGGVIVRSADGRLVYDNSFGARLARLAPTLRRELTAKIFEKNP